MKTLDTDLQISPRPSEAVSIRIFADVLQSLNLEAGLRDMSLEALLRLYIGAGLRQDIAKRYSERLLDTTARVLSKHMSSESEVSEILREIREQAVPHSP